MKNLFSVLFFFNKHNQFFMYRIVQLYNEDSAMKIMTA